MFKTSFTLTITAICYSLSIASIANATSPSDSAIEQVDSAPKEVVYFLEITLNRPAQEIWPYLQSDKLKLWAPVHSYYPVSGPPGSEGHRYRSMPVDKTGNDVDYPVVHYELIKVIPYKLQVVKLEVQESASSARRLTGYSTTTLDEAQGKTRLRNVQVSILKPGAPGKKSHLTKDKQTDMFYDVYSQLKKRVESENSPQ